MQMPRVVRRLPERFGVGYLAAAGFCLLFAFLAFLLLAQSNNDRLLWTGHTAVGPERNGLVYYSWHGQNYELDVPGFANKPRVAIVFDPSNPFNAERDLLVDRVTDALLTVFPAAVAVLLLVAGHTRHRWRSRRHGRNADGYGGGLDEDLVSQLLDRQRNGPS